MHRLKLALQFIDTQHKACLPRATLRQWIKAALFSDAEITLRFVDAAEGKTLNHHYRGKDYATNVLTFPLTNIGEGPVLADIVLCSSVIAHETVTQNKPLLAHYAHMVIHATLHAQGYEHESEEDAQEMEALEVTLLAKLGFANPYS